MHRTDHDLDLRRAQSGDEAAFTRVFRRVQPRLLRYLSVMAGPQSEDIAAETWVRVARDLAGFRGDAEAFRAWVFQIARHRWIDHLRATERRPAQTDDAVLGEMAAPGGVLESVEELISTEAALRLIARLPPDQAEVVLLRVVAGLDVARCAEVLGKRPGTVRVLAHRGLARLRALLPDPGSARTSSVARGVTESAP